MTIFPGRRKPTSDNPQLKWWRRAIAQEAMIRRLKKFDREIPLSVSLEFVLERPPSVRKKRKHPSVRPDLDKLIRAICDALTGVIWVDDAQVCRLRDVRKCYGQPARVEITVEPLLGDKPNG